MKIGIVTWYDVINYGSVFQAYALQQMISNAGHEAIILQHDRQIKAKSNTATQIHSLYDVLKWLRDQTPNRRRNRSLEIVKKQKYLTFHNDYLNIGVLYSKATDMNSVIIGSDQIFDVKYFFHGFQFGHGIPCEDISAYAPSFGESKLADASLQEHVAEIKSGISKMRCISARDTNTQKIIAELTDRIAPIVIDPVLAYGFAEEKVQWNRCHIDGRYLLIYAWGGTTVTPGFSDNVLRFARMNGLKTASVGDYRDWCDINYAAASPIEFFELMRYADMVITNMFHGTCFSILHNKPFYSISMPHNRNKLEGLLMHLQLESQLVTDVSRIGEMDYPNLNYSIIKSRLEENRVISMDFLSRILHK